MFLSPALQKKFFLRSQCWGLQARSLAFSPLFNSLEDGPIYLLKKNPVWVELLGANVGSQY